MSARTKTSSVLYIVTLPYLSLSKSVILFCVSTVSECSKTSRTSSLADVQRKRAFFSIDSLERFLSGFKLKHSLMTAMVLLLLNSRLACQNERKDNVTETAGQPNGQKQYQKH